ncbi:MAG: hypothetical protein Q7T05_08055 [Dehalococcoidia bacterium]|nr:hypothetical protein [Dehalococcoidia bacterium]
MSHRNLFVTMIVLVGSVLVLMASTVTGQATNPISLSAIQPLGKPLGAPAVSPTPAYTVYLPLVIRSAASAATPTPTQTATVGAGTPTPTGTAVPTTPPGTQGALFLNRTFRTDSASAAVDAAGGSHLAYARYGAMVDGNQVYYAYCTANCGTESSWAAVMLIDRVEEVQLALTSDGHPRLLLRGPSPDWSTDFYKYAACDTNCTSSANWTIVDVTTTAFSPVYVNSYSGHHYFALDNLDRPRFLYQNTYTEAFYVYCDTTCTSPENWLKYPVNVDIFTDANTHPTLTFTSLGQPRITAVMGLGPTDYLAYITCDTACNDPASWTYAPLMERGSGHVSFVLRFTSTGQPRLVFNQGTISGTSGYLYYLWCSADCTVNTSWAGSSVGAQGQAEDPDLALNALNRPRIAFRSILSPDGLGYSWCDTNCESVSATWLGGLLEPSSDLDIEWDILPPLNCSGSYWWDGYRPSLALDTAGNPRIGYVAQHLHGGGSSCTVAEDFRAVRFAFFNQP